jgi:Domain of unknown function (DUF4157)
MIAPLRQTISKPALARAPVRTGLLQRKCACGGTPGPTGECEECSKKKRFGLQAKLKVNKPSDIYEQEADRVAEAVVNGKTTGRPPISSLGSGSAVQRQEPAKPKTEEEKYKEAAKKVGEAFLETAPGKEIKKKAEELGDAFIATLPGKIITGAGVAGAIATLAATHKELPIGIPEIPLDKIKPGLKMKITYEGPVDKPTKVMATFSFPLPGGKSSEKKPKLTESEKFRAETARMAAEQAKFREGLKSPEEKAAEEKMLYSYVASRMLRPDQLTPRVSPLSFGVAGEHLGFKPLTLSRGAIGPWSPPFKLTGEAPATESATKEEPKKKEEESLQRKAAGGHEISAVPPIVDQVLQSSGQPLDAATRAFMEPRFGYDFSQVRVHANDAAARSARSVNAIAYTVGNRIAFDTGRLAPDTREGRKLLAHELAHTLQQAERSTADAKRISDGRDPAEQEADRGACDVMAGRPAAVAAHANAQTLYRQPKSAAEKEVKEEGGEAVPAKDIFAGTMITEIIISLARKRVGFRWAMGMILGAVDTDLKPGKYELKPDVANQKWVIEKPSVKSGLRFDVDLEGARPWTLSYPETVPLTVVAGAKEPKPTAKFDPQRDLADPLWLYEGSPENLEVKPVSGIDDFESTTYDFSYRSDKGGLSKWLRVSYRDNTIKDINIDSITEATPKLWAVRRKVLIAMDDYTSMFILEFAFPAVFMIITINPLGIPQAGKGAKYTATARRFSKVSGEEIVEPPVKAGEPGAKAGEPVPKTVPKVEEVIPKGAPPAGGGAGGPAPKGARILVVGAETEAEFAYALERTAAGQRVTVVNPRATEAADAYSKAGGNFIKGKIESLPKEPVFDLIREDFPYPTGKHLRTIESVSERLARLKSGGRWVIITEEAEEFLPTLESAARSKGAKVTTYPVPAAHEGTPQSSYPKGHSRFTVIVEKP